MILTVDSSDVNLTVDSSDINLTNDLIDVIYKLKAYLIKLIIKNPITKSIFINQVNKRKLIL